MKRERERGSVRGSERSNERSRIRGKEPQDVPGNEERQQGRGQQRIWSREVYTEDVSIDNRTCRVSHDGVPTERTIGCDLIKLKL